MNQAVSSGGEDGRTAHVQFGKAGVVALLCFVVGYRPEIFFAVLGLVGARYDGSASSPLYWGFVVALGFGVYIHVTYLLIRGDPFGSGRLLVLTLPFIFTVFYLFDAAIGRTQDSSASHFLLALAFAAPAALAGAVASRPHVLLRMPQALELVMLLLTATVLLSTWEILAGSADRGVGGATYQTAAYLGGLAFNLNLHFALFDTRRNWARLGLPVKGYTIFATGLLPLQVIAVVLAGGRGAFVLVVLGALVQFTLALWGRSSKMLRRSFLIGLPVVLGALVVGPRLLADPTTSRLVERVFAYIGEDGINWEGTSGRDVVYSQAWAAFLEAPLFGHGLYSWGMWSYPHNLALEFLLNGGILYAVVCIFLLFVLLKRFMCFWRRFGGVRLMLPLVLYPFVMLQFSASYMTSGHFWFAICFIATLNETELQDVERGSRPNNWDSRSSS